jgi:cbb3-type cytochrome oxidase subunit 3
MSMKQDVLANFEYFWLTNLTMILAIIIFIGILFWVFVRKSAKKDYTEAERLPFDEGNQYGSESENH